jgi:hypothetical protein
MLEGAGESTYHLVGYFFRDPDGTLAWGAKTYIIRIINHSEAILGGLRKKWTSPVDTDDPPELDTSKGFQLRVFYTSKAFMCLPMGHLTRAIRHPLCISTVYNLLSA